MCTVVVKNVQGKKNIFFWFHHGTIYLFSNIAYTVEV